MIPYYVREFDTPEEVENWLNDEKREDTHTPIFGIRRKITEETADGELIVVDVYYVIGQAETVRPP